MTAPAPSKPRAPHRAAEARQADYHKLLSHGVRDQTVLAQRLGVSTRTVERYAASPGTKPQPRDAINAELAACRTADPDLFFPTSYQATQPQVMEAKAVCHTCPILAACLTYALQAGEGDGIWGGTTPPERRRLHATRTRRSAP